MIDHRINTDLGWEPGRTLWAAQIIASEALRISETDHINVLIRSVIWPSRDEAVAYLQRRMPTTGMPLCSQPGSYISGQIAPAYIEVTPTADEDGEPRFVEQIHVRLGAAHVYPFHLDKAGVVRPGARPRPRTLVAA